MKVKLTLLDDMLGTMPTQKSIWTDYVAGKMTKGMKRDGKTEDEINAELESTLDGVEDIDELERGLTGFLKDEKGYYIPHYMVKGLLKEAGRVMKEFGKGKTAIKQLQSKVSHGVFISPNKIYVAPADAKLEICERPLRADTPKGPRTSIARSYVIPAGTILEFEVHVPYGTLPDKCIVAMLDHGRWSGLGQWRSAGKGRFSWEDVSDQ
ncbi:MAG: hypothetical protein KGZ39_05715 [Simkania sp.]|nr:hypothetical protein [Simkania sp.]